MNIYGSAELLGHLLELQGARDRAHEEHRLHTRVDAVEALDAPEVPLVHAGVRGIIVPEGVVIAPVGRHLAPRHHLDTHALEPV